jgi:para-nitrobenzyl esterase
MLAYHGAELPYAFGHLNPAEDYDRVDAEVSDTLLRAWTEFARSGVPSSPDGAPWPAAASTTPQLAVIGYKTRICTLEISPVTALINFLRGRRGHPVIIKMRQGSAEFPGLDVGWARLRPGWGPTPISEAS